MHKIWLLISACILSACCTFAQERTSRDFNPQKKYPVSELQTDFRLLMTALEQSHPGLYSFNTKEETRHRFDSLYNSLRTEQTELQFYSTVSSALANIGCGHTAAFLSKKYRKEFEEKNCRYFPFQVKVQDHRLYILSNRSTDSSIVPGAEILELNGKPARDIERQILPYLTSDGHSETLKQYELTNGFMYYYAEFVGQPKWFQLRLRIPGDELDKLATVPALNLDDIHKINEKRNLSLQSVPKTKPLHFRINSEKIAVLTIHSFDDDDISAARQHFRSFIRSAFDSIKQQGVNDLVIDIRNNGGGDDYNASYLYSFLTDTAFKYYDRVEVTSDKKLSFLRHTDKPLLFRLFRLFVKSDPDFPSRHLWTYSRALRVQQPNPASFRGEVFVLINGGSFSATSEFAALADFHKRAVFIGEETGGNYQGDNSGLELILTLPNTHIRVRIPQMKYVLAVDHARMAGRGIMPNYTILPGIKDFLTGKDPEEEFTLDLIQKKNCKACGR
jgi:hypothetical protein